MRPVMARCVFVSVLRACLCCARVCAFFGVCGLQCGCFNVYSFTYLTIFAFPPSYPFCCLGLVVCRACRLCWCNTAARTNQSLSLTQRIRFCSGLKVSLQGHSSSSSSASSSASSSSSSSSSFCSASSFFAPLCARRTALLTPTTHTYHAPCTALIDDTAAAASKTFAVWEIIVPAGRGVVPARAPSPAGGTSGSAGGARAPSPVGGAAAPAASSAAAAVGARGRGGAPVSARGGARGGARGAGSGRATTGRGQ